MEKTNKIDVICPIFHIDLESFETIINSWFQNIPINYLIIGLGKKNNELESLLSKFSNVIIFHQYLYKTLGYCLEKLINAIGTDYFIYLHSDVEIPANWFDRMWESRVKGILESLKDPFFGPEALVQARKPRAYSGAQLIFKKSVQNLNWDDDFIYTNEDLILRNLVLQRGYAYLKTPIYHIHHRDLSKRTQPREIILEWQFKGIIKYCKPSRKLLTYLKSVVKSLDVQHGLKFDLKEEIMTISPNWLELYK